MVSYWLLKYALLNNLLGCVHSTLTFNLLSCIACMMCDMLLWRHGIEKVSTAFNVGLSESLR